MQTCKTKKSRGVEKLIEFKQEFLHDVEDDLKELGRLHMEEVHHQHELLPVEFDEELYRKAESFDLLRIFTARSEDALVGYLVVVITPDMHSKGKFLASDDGFFVKKEYRKNGNGVKLLRFAEKCLKEDGFETLHISTTEMNPIDDLLTKMGYKQIERKYERVL